MLCTFDWEWVSQELDWCDETRFDMTKKKIELFVRFYPSRKNTITA